MTITTTATPATAGPPARVPWRKRLYTWVLVGILAGGVLGALAPGFAAMLKLILIFYGTSLFFVIDVLGSIAWKNGVNIFELLRYMKDELLIVRARARRSRSCRTSCASSSTSARRSRSTT